MSYLKYTAEIESGFHGESDKLVSLLTLRRILNLKCTSTR